LSEIYNLWTDGREDTFSERRSFLGTDSKETSSSRYLGNLPCCIRSEPQRARHTAPSLRLLGPSSSFIIFFFSVVAPRLSLSPNSGRLRCSSRPLPEALPWY
jgi:hypothetical protein